MGMMNVGLAALVFLVVVFILIKIVMQPIKLLWKVLFNSALGLILLMLVNYGGSFLNFALQINIITVLVAGFLGIPGILLLICFQLLLK
jgi:inhibitor of the pro-sigma K processing machinery